MSERPWCVAHDRSAEFVTTDQERVCWIGLCDPEAWCRLVLVTVERKGEARLARIAEAVSEWNHTGDNYAAYKRIRELLASAEPA